MLSLKDDHGPKAKAHEQRKQDRRFNRENALDILSESTPQLASNKDDTANVQNAIEYAARGNDRCKIP